MMEGLPSIAAHARAHGISPQKKLGQNFIFDLSLCDKIVRSIPSINGKHILEIGPGPGGLTRAILAQSPSKLTVIEKDPRCLELLKDIQKLYPNLEIISGDALKVKLSDITKEKICIIANLPYNIGTELVFRWLDSPELVESMTLMLQKEVVDRICAKHDSKAYGKLSVMCQLLTEARKEFDVSPAAFYPPPKVHSAIVTMIPKEPYMDKNLIEKVRGVAHLAFTGRRKMLRSSLKGIDLSGLNIDETARAEDLSPEDYLRIASVSHPELDSGSRETPEALNQVQDDYILGIESSCDDTSVAIVRGDKTILANIVVSQLKDHAPYSGVVPEIASRAHMRNLESAAKEALQVAGLQLKDIDAIAVTAGPGLIGGVIVGTMFAKGLASVLKKPFIAVNHLEGHALTARLTSDVEFPYLLLLASGGHCQFIAALGVGQYKILGATLDDAVGEAFDKTAKLLGLGYPGGPVIEQLAKLGDATAYKLPFSMTDRAGCDMSFSGLKTAVRQLVEKQELITEKIIADICASFQYTVGEILAKRACNAIMMFQEICGGRDFVIAGGVAANLYLRERLEKEVALEGFKLTAPPVSLCTDNAAMIAFAGLERLKLGLTDDLSFCPKARWSLEDLY